MKKIVLPALLIGILLLVLSYGLLFVLVNVFPSLAEEYFNPAFRRMDNRSVLYFLHPFVISFALAWFWKRFKEPFKGAFWVRGLEFGGVYALIATLPSMWITFSAIELSISMVLSWLAYGLLQAVLAGVLLARMNP